MNRLKRPLSGSLWEYFFNNPVVNIVLKTPDKMFTITNRYYCFSAS